MGVEVDQAEPSVPPGQRTQDRQRDGVVASHGDRHDACPTSVSISRWIAAKVPSMEMGTTSTSP